ncbi:metal ABC transporter substrate-binding protein [Desulfatiferula olefinivorans]
MDRRRVPRMLVLFLFIALCPLPLAAESGLSVLATTFPVYQMTRNVTKGRANLTVDLMLPADLGCPHDYALTPGDMRALARSRVLVVNGLGLEEFLGASIAKANPSITVIDSTSGITDLIYYADDDDHHHHDHHGHDHGHGRDEDRTPNPHLFAGPRMAARMVMTIARGLSTVDPDGRTLYEKNAGAYAQTLETLARTMAERSRRLIGRRIVTQHGAFDYLARDLDLTITAYIQSHAGREPSASDLLHTMAVIRKEKAGAIVTEPQYPGKIASTLSRETGIPLILLDPVATGPAMAPLDYYEKKMMENLAVLEKTLGVRPDESRD